MSQEHSKACCTTPVATSGPYSEKGQWSEIDGMKTYTTQPSSDTKKAIIYVYDIFGYTPQTLQGADILANAGYSVFVPDWFVGSRAELQWTTNRTPENQAKINSWVGEFANPGKIIPRIGAMTAALKERYPSLETWCVIGYCWGGKLVALTSAEGTPFAVAAQSSPAMVDPADAAKVTIPMIVLASKDEDADKVKAFGEALGDKGEVVTFKDQVHGWMSARANLDDEYSKKEYERGYKLAVDFFNKWT